jgi:hypothetical protein
MEQVHREYRSRGLVILAVNIEETREEVAAWVRDKKLTIDVLLDSFGDATTDWTASFTPMVYVVGRDGRLVARAIGNRGWTTPEGRAFLEALVTQ